MKIITIILLLLSPVMLFSETCEEALDESSKLLERAYNTIEELENEVEALKKGTKVEELNNRIKELESESMMYGLLLAESNVALDESNKLLQKAYDRIEEDDKEIKELREHIKSLVNAGVEVRTYSWNIMVTSGYPLSIGLAVGYNLPFLTNIGFMVGIDYNITNNIPAFKAGVKLNLDKN